MAGAEVESLRAVAFFDVFYRPVEEGEFRKDEKSLGIDPNSDFFIGRAEDCKYSFRDPHVSMKHLHITCIIFDEAASANTIPPLVYVQDFSTNGTFLRRATSSISNTTEEQRLSRQDGKILLAPGDRVRICPKVELEFRFAGNVDPNAARLPRAQRREAELFADRYTITNQVLGSGGYGDVLAAIHKKTNRQLACKVVDLTRCVKKTRKQPLHDVTNSSPVARRDKSGITRDSILDSQQFREFDILQDLDHPNIVHLEKVFWSESTLFIFQELITGGDLFSYVIYREVRLLDPEVAVILMQILKGVEYLHDCDIVHRDLKPDNILISTSTDAPLRIIITDFGGCRRLESNNTPERSSNIPQKRMHTFVGTTGYFAPEMYNNRHPASKGYTKAIDMWSIGIIATMLFTGEIIFHTDHLPMPSQEQKKMLAELSNACDLRVMDNPWGPWREVGKRPKDFVRHLLVVDEGKRYTAKQALAHPWFTNSWCREQFEELYQKAIASWQPRRKAFRVIEKLDLSRLPPLQQQPAERSRFFNDLSATFPQGELYPHGVQTPKKHRALMESINEEAAIDHEDTPRRPRHFAAQVESLAEGALVREINRSMSQIQIYNDPATPPLQAPPFVDIPDHDMYEEDSHDLYLPPPPRSTPPRMLFASAPSEKMEETPLRHLLKRSRQDEVRGKDAMEDDTYDSSLDIVEGWLVEKKEVKKVRLFR